MSVADGLVTAVGPGRATVTAASGSARGTARAEVIQEPASILVSPSAFRFLILDDTVRLSARVRDARHRPIVNASVVWASDAPAVATVDESGVVMAVGDGTATVAASLGAVGDSATITVSIVSSVSVAPSTLRLPALGDTMTLSATVFGSDGLVIPGAAVEWASDDPGVATVNRAGLVTAIGNGSATVTGRSGAEEATVPVAVEQVPASIVVSPDSVTLIRWDTVTLSATVLDRRGNKLEAPPSLTWTSGDASVVEVSATGHVRAVGFGRTQVTALADTISGSAALRVSSWRAYEHQSTTTSGGEIHIWIARSVLGEISPPMNPPYDEVVTLMGYLCNVGGRRHDELSFRFLPDIELTNETDIADRWKSSDNPIRWGDGDAIDTRLHHRVALSQEDAGLFFFRDNAEDAVNVERAASGVAQVTLELQVTGSGLTTFTYLLGEDARDAINEARIGCGLPPHADARSRGGPDLGDLLRPSAVHSTGAPPGARFEEWGRIFGDEVMATKQ